MATRPKAVIESRNGEEFSPITITKNVLTDDGQNLHDILSDRKEDMMTPTIENSSSMFKVGQGDNVDYSENVVDGAYESCVFKGKSLVNLSNLHKSFNDVTLNDYYVDTSLCETSKLKLGTPYTLVFYTTVHGGDHDIYGNFELGVGNVLHATNTHPTTTTSYSGTLVKNGWSKKCVTFTDFRGYKYLSLRPIRCNAPESGKSIRFSIKGFILLEGDWSNKDLPFNGYFEGICDCKSPILSNVGKNLFDASYVGNYEHWETNTGVAFNNYPYVRIQLKQNTNYVFTRNDTNNPSKTGRRSHIVVHTLENRNSGEWLYHHESPSLNQKEIKIRTSSSGVLIFANSTCENQTDLTDMMFGFSRSMIEESSSATTYEPYKSNILSFNQKDNKTIVLRSLPNGVCDTLNVETGEYVQRIGEVVLDGSYIAHSNQSGYSSITSTAVLLNLKSSEPPQNRITKFICKDLPHYLAGDAIWAKGTPVDTGISGVSGAWDFCIRLPYTVTGGTSADSNDVIRQKFKEYLNTNPVTVQYELATPIVSTVDIQGFPYAYTNGHVQLSSSSIEQSLTPKVEYSVATNRNGQIRSNQKMVERHQKQLDRLQAMILTNLVNTQYEQTLTNLKYDLKNVREEVK